MTSEYAQIVIARNNIKLSFLLTEAEALRSAPMTDADAGIAWLDTLLTSLKLAREAAQKLDGYIAKE